MIHGIGVTSKQDPLPCIYYDHANEITVEYSGTHIVLIQGQPVDDTGAPFSPSQCLALFLAKGKDICHHLHGHFALIISTHQRKELFFCTDKMGTYELYYCHDHQQLSVATNLKFIQQWHHSIHLNPQSVYDYFYFHMVPGPQTIFEDVYKVPGGHYGHFRSGKYDLQEYWQASFTPQDLPFEEKKRALFDALDAALPPPQYNQSLGCFLSGGIDSSTVLGRLANQQHGIDAFTIGFEIEQFDEQQYAKLAAKTFSANHHVELLTPKHLLETLPKLASFCAQPFGNASIIPTHFCANMARLRGIECLVAGDGGDELFGGNQRYAKQLVLGKYTKLPKSLRQTLLEPLFASQIGSLPWLKKVRSYIQQANIPLPERLETYNLLHRLGTQQVFADAFLSHIDEQHPIAALKATYSKHNTDNVLNNILALDYKLTLSDNDLVKVRRATQAAGINVVFPFLQSQVVDFAATLTQKDKVNGQQLRPFFKQACQGFLPKDILTKSKHGFGMPFGQWVLNDPELRSFVINQVQQFEERAILKPEFLQALIHSKLPSHPNYYGVMVWLVVALETWLSTNEKCSNYDLEKKLNTVQAHNSEALLVT